jgi:sugar/nucleoside kinase (ribokinase family)
LVYEEEGRKNSHQAVAARRAGATSILVSFVGDDEIGKKCLKSLRSCGIDTRFVSVAKGESTEVNHQYMDKVTRDYTLERFPCPLSNWYTPEMVEQYSEQVLSASAVILVSKQPKDFLTKMIDFCYENKIPTILTVSHEKFNIQDKRDLETLRKCTFIAGNLEETQTLSGKNTPEEILKTLPNSIITHGASGVWFCDESGKMLHEEAVPPEKIVEINGAGDTFAGNFIVFYSEGKPIQECVRLGMCASAIEISKMGVVAAMPFRPETEELYRKHFGTVI